NKLDLRIDGKAGTALAAWPKARALRLVGNREEGYLIAPGPPRRACRSAIDARRAHAVDESAVEIGSSFEHCIPPRLIIPNLQIFNSFRNHHHHLESDHKRG